VRSVECGVRSAECGVRSLAHPPGDLGPHGLAELVQLVGHHVAHSPRLVLRRPSTPRHTPGQRQTHMDRTRHDLSCLGPVPADTHTGRHEHAWTYKHTKRSNRVAADYQGLPGTL